MRLAAVVLVALALLGLEGCAGSVEQWIVNTRIHQGNLALSDGSLHEALTAYRLALRMSPHDPRARRGFSSASALVAQADFRHGDLEDALATVNAAEKVDPGSVRLQALRTQFEEAKIKREIVLSNYPTYESAGTELEYAYEALAPSQKEILHDLARFNYTYDTNDLTAAIKSSYDLELDVAKNTNRLIAFRQLVEAGVPAPERGTAPSASGSLLPLP